MNLRIESAVMVDRQKVETVLRRRFPGADWAQIAAATNAIVGLGDEWEEVLPLDLQCLNPQVNDGIEFRFFRRSPPSGDSHVSVMTTCPGRDQSRETRTTKCGSYRGVPSVDKP